MHRKGISNKAPQVCHLSGIFKQ